ncbi:hypothetical protein [Caballeronia sp.]|uniref:hypothetical protein n=1 Tax=Caballeronia sp. TaxID=1931223 RepID=UPI003C453697
MPDHDIDDEQRAIRKRVQVSERGARNADVGQNIDARASDNQRRDVASGPCTECGQPDRPEELKFRFLESHVSSSVLQKRMFLATRVLE